MSFGDSIGFLGGGGGQISSSRPSTPKGVNIATRHIRACVHSTYCRFYLHLDIFITRSCPSSRFTGCQGGEVIEISMIQSLLRHRRLGNPRKQLIPMQQSPANLTGPRTELFDPTRSRKRLKTLLRSKIEIASFCAGTVSFLETRTLETRCTPIAWISADPLMHGACNNSMRSLPSKST